MGLSDKEEMGKVNHEYMESFYMEKDVKAFIKEFDRYIRINYNKSPSKMRILDKLRELAGDKLI